MSDRYDRYEDLRIASKNVEERGLDADVLCARCTRGHLYRRRGKLVVEVYCHAVESRVPSDIAECSDFRDAKAMDLDDMNRIAVLIDKRKDMNDKAYL